MFLPKRYYIHLFVFLISIPASAQYKYAFQNSSLPIEQRVNNLIEQLTIDEKISLLLYNSPGVKRLNIPAYNWWK